MNALSMDPLACLIRSIAPAKYEIFKPIPMQPGRAMATSKVVLHVGAHKTATTYLQQLFYSNRPTLESDCGLSYVPMIRFRAAVTTQLERGDTSPWKRQIIKSLRAYDSAAVSQSCDLLVSDENLIGDCGEIMRSGRLYPRLLTRLRRLRRLVGSDPREVWFAIRSYDDFLASAYIEANRHAKAFLSWDSTAGRVDLGQRRWPQVLADVRSAFPETRLRVWAFEQFVNRERAVVADLIGQSAQKFQYKSEAVRASSSGDAMRVAELLSQKLGSKVAATVFTDLDALLPKTAARPGFSPWKEDEQAALRRLYDVDLQLIAQTDGIEMLQQDANVVSAQPVVSA